MNNEGNEKWMTQFEKLSFYEKQHNQQQQNPELHQQHHYEHHWRDIAPMTVSERQKMYLQNPRCFLDISDPQHPKYPVCPIGSTTPTEQGFDAAIRRARMQHNQKIINIAKERQKEYGFGETTQQFSPRKTRSSTLNENQKTTRTRSKSRNRLESGVNKTTTRKRTVHKRKVKKEPKVVKSPRSIIKQEGSIKKQTKLTFNSNKNKTKTIPNRDQLLA